MAGSWVQSLGIFRYTLIKGVYHYFPAVRPSTSINPLPFLHIPRMHPSQRIHCTRCEKLQGKGIPHSIEMDGGASIRSMDYHDNDDDCPIAIVVAHGQPEFIHPRHQVRVRLRVRGGEREGAARIQFE
jgi:hypothetical protein